MQALCRGRVNNELCADRRGIPAGARQSAGVSVYWVVRQGGQQSGGVAGGVTQGGGEVATAVEAQDADGEVAEAGHGSWCVAGADLGGVLGVIPISG